MSGPLSPAALLASGLSHPLCLDIWLTRNLKPFLDPPVTETYYDLEPDVLWYLACQAAKTTSISEVNRAKIEAVRTVAKSDLPYTYWPAFEKVTMAFNGVIPIPDVCQKPDLGQILVSVDILSAMRDTKLSDEVYRYIAASLLADDIYVAPSAIGACNEIMKPLSHGNTDRILSKIAGSDNSDEAVNWHRHVAITASNYAKEVAQRFSEQFQLVTA